MKCFCEDGTVLNVHRLEQCAIDRALTQSKGNKRVAAQVLGMSLNTLYAKIARMGWRERSWTETPEKKR